MWNRIKHAIGTAIFVSAIVGSVLIYPLWQHHDVQQDSPSFATEAEARGWLRRFEAEGEGAKCLDWAREAKVIDEGYSGGWFVTYRCNSDRALVRVAIGYLVPFALVLLLGYLLSSQQLRKPRK